jgi:uncharacterized protein (TIGR02001 family)
MENKMNFSMKKAFLATAISASTVLSANAFAGASANIGVTSNYVWRGVTQSDDQAAVSGGLDYEADSGLYIGTWVSNVNFPAGGVDDRGYELDFYGGFASELSNGLGYDVGVISYQYPSHNPNAHFEEVYAKGSYGPVEAGLAYTFNAKNNASEGDIYYHLGASTELSNGVSLGGTVGRYDFDAGSSGDYTHYQLSASKSDFTFAIDDTNISGSDPIVSVSWSKSFDL